MKKFKPIIRCVIFLAGLAAIMGVIDFACVQTGYVNYILRNVCAKDNGTDYDTVVIGASHARASDRKSTRLNSSHPSRSRMPSSA